MKEVTSQTEQTIIKIYPIQLIRMINQGNKLSDSHSIFFDRLMVNRFGVHIRLKFATRSTRSNGALGRSPRKPCPCLLNAAIVGEYCQTTN
jgi:hypothetical protein